MNVKDKIPQQIIQIPLILNNICILCGIEDESLVNIYSEEVIEHDISNKLELYLPAETLENCKLSSQCCWECITSVLAWHKFVQKTLEATLKFKELHSGFVNDKQEHDHEERDESLPTSASLYVFCSNFEDRNGGDSLKNDSQSYSGDDENINDVNCDLNKTKNEEEIRMNSSKLNITPDDLTDNCYFCSETFLTEEDLLNHTNDNHSEISDDEGPQQIKNKYKQKIRAKIDQTLISEAKTIVDDRVFYNCKECGKTLLSPYTYLWHTRIHTGERPFLCDLCGKQFRVSQGLVRHLKETHERIKNFPCDICGRMFATKRNVDEHRRIHTNERPYICTHCDKAFKQKASLFVHNRTHSDTFPFRCDYCNQGFRSKAPLLVHVTKHTGQKPYPCEICGRCFRIKYELKRHRLVHSEEKPFTCSRCGLGFKQKRYLKNHLKVNHGGSSESS